LRRCKKKRSVLTGPQVKLSVGESQKRGDSFNPKTDHPEEQTNTPGEGGGGIKKKKKSPVGEKFAGPGHAFREWRSKVTTVDNPSVGGLLKTSTHKNNPLLYDDFRKKKEKKGGPGVRAIPE